MVPDGSEKANERLSAVSVNSISRMDAISYISFGSLGSGGKLSFGGWKTIIVYIHKAVHRRAGGSSEPVFSICNQPCKRTLSPVVDAMVFAMTIYIAVWSFPI